MQQKALIRIVDDDPNCVDSVQFLLENEGWRTLTATSAEAFLASDIPSEPGAVILDVKMPHMNGLTLQSLLVERDYPHPIIFLSAHGDISMAVATTKKGSFDFLEKPVNPEKLLQTVEAAVALDMNRIRPDPALIAAKFSTLTEREKQICRLTLQGLSSKEIATVLQITSRTAESHRANIYRKLGIKSSAELKELCRSFEL